MHGLNSINHDGTVDIKGLSSEFSKLYEELERQVDQNQDIEKCKSDLASISRQLTSVAHSLSHFDQELYSTKIDLLLKKITTKQLQTSRNDDRRQRWKSRARPSVKPPAVTATAMPLDDKPAAIHTQTSDTTIEYEISKNSYRNLKNCKLIYTGTKLLQEFATLAVQDVENSIVYFNVLPFHQGSLLLERFKDSRIVIITPKGSNLQLRLHEMHHCQLYIRKEQADQVQDVIIEDFSNCVFHEASEKSIHIHNFNQLNYQNKEINDGYTFGNFPFDAESPIR